MPFLSGDRRTPCPPISADKADALSAYPLWQPATLPATPCLLTRPSVLTARATLHGVGNGVNGAEESIDGADVHDVAHVARTLLMAREGQRTICRQIVAF